MKYLLRSSPVAAGLGWLIWCYMALCGRTIRWRIEGEAEARAAWAAPPGILVTAWHSTILLLPAGWTRAMRHWPGRNGPAGMLISHSPDGAAVAAAIRHLGLSPIRGSSTHRRKRKDKGGMKAISEVSRFLRIGGAVCITPDGPRGPRQKVSEGAALLALRSGALILPYALASRPTKRLNTWDKFQIPFPFSKGAIVFGPVIEVDRCTPTSDLSKMLEAALTAATARAETLCAERS